MTKIGRPAAPPGRRAFTMIEVAVATLLLAIAMTLTVQILGWVAAERRALERRQCAIGEVANILERLAARPWGRLSAETAKTVTLSETARRSLPDAELTVKVAELAEGGDAKRILVSLRWRTRQGNWDAPVRLAAWSYRRRDER